MWEGDTPSRAAAFSFDSRISRGDSSGVGREPGGNGVGKRLFLLVRGAAAGALERVVAGGIGKLPAGDREAQDDGVRLPLMAIRVGLEQSALVDGRLLPAATEPRAWNSTTWWRWKGGGGSGYSTTTALRGSDLVQGDADSAYQVRFIAGSTPPGSPRAEYRPAFPYRCRHSE